MKKEVTYFVSKFMPYVLTLARVKKSVRLSFHFTSVLNVHCFTFYLVFSSLGSIVRLDAGWSQKPQLGFTNEIKATISEFRLLMQSSFLLHDNMFIKGAISEFAKSPSLI